MRIKFFTLSLLLVLAGCATTENYEKFLNSFVGRSELELVRAWGPPMRSYEAGGHKFLVYSSLKTIRIAGKAPTYKTTVEGNTTISKPVGGYPPQDIELNCQTTFEVFRDRVIAGRWQGNDCAAYENEGPKSGDR